MQRQPYSARGKHPDIISATPLNFGPSPRSILFRLLSLQPPAQVVIKLSQMNESLEAVGRRGVSTDVQIKCE